MNKGGERRGRKENSALCGFHPNYWADSLLKGKGWGRGGGSGVGPELGKEDGALLCAQGQLAWPSRLLFCVLCVVVKVTSIRGAYRFLSDRQATHHTARAPLVPSVVPSVVPSSVPSAVPVVPSTADLAHSKYLSRK